ncbi:MAG: hypothetical protein HZC37_13625 [Burkholderiales bacterium]|nr:hypothetical protein [Burkholderiales bacterium]
MTGLLVLEDGTHCDDTRALAEGKLAAVREKLTDLRRIERALKGLIDRCSEHESNISCPMITALQIGPRGHPRIRGRSSR